MRVFIRSLFSAFVLCIAAGLPAAAQDAEKEIGYVSQKAYFGAKGHRVSGSVEDLKYRTELWSNETVRTGGQGVTTLRFLDKTKLQVSNNSEVVLDRFVYDDDTDTGEMAMAFTKGAFRFITGHMENLDGFKLRTPTVAIGIRGTDFKVRVAADGTTTVSVLEGQVEVTPLGGGSGANIGEGQSAIGTATGVTTAQGDAVGSGMNMESNKY
ncbi:MAG: hypothetical protein HOH66_01735 [Rhodospirillaceae bacterium]|jgi:hypothetical protein|nr:hypothetical protein [Rhodospirillaceae bacterium]